MWNKQEFLADVRRVQELDAPGSLYQAAREKTKIIYKYKKSWLALRKMAKEMEKEAMGSIPVPQDIEIAKAVNPDKEEASQALQFIKQMDILTHSGLTNAIGIVADIKKKADYVDEKRKSFVDPLRKVVDDINAFFKEPLSDLAEAEKALKSKISGYCTKKMEEHDEILDTMEPEQDTATKRAILDRADRCVPPKISGMSLREAWGGKVDNPEALIQWAIENNRLELLLPNEKALKALTKTQARDPKIPGWKAERKHSVAITVSKIKA